LQKLYDLGARRVLVTGTGPMGCAPAERAMRGINGECGIELQRAANLYNPQLVQMLQGLNQEIGSDVFIAADAYRMHMDYISNPQAYGMCHGKYINLVLVNINTIFGRKILTNALKY
jgi:hypothetical protein